VISKFKKGLVDVLERKDMFVWFQRKDSGLKGGLKVGLKVEGWVEGKKKLGFIGQGLLFSVRGC
jgi:hypothetical protein